MLDDAAKATLYRQHNMRALSASYRSLELIVRHGLEREAHLEGHATALISAARQIENNFAFPAPATDGQNGARTLIWQDHKGFVQQAQALVRSSDSLLDAVNTELVERQSLIDSLDAVRQQCLDCHDRYRHRP